MANENNKIRAYKMTHATGFAPNPFGKVLTLACCKPQIRNKTEVGDVIIGIGTDTMERNFRNYCKEEHKNASNISLNNRIIYVMKVAEVIPWTEYYKWCHEGDPARLCKCHESGTPADMYGDCIYRWKGKTTSELSFAEYVQSFEFVSNPSHEKEKNAVHDLGGKSVIIGDPEKSYFFGRKSISSHHIGDLKSFHRASYGKILDWDEEELFERLKAYRPVSDMSFEELEKLVVPALPEWSLMKDMKFSITTIEYDEIKESLEKHTQKEQKKIVRGKPVIVISRKGFDTCYGRYPSLIIDKQMISFPIPEDSDQTYNYYDECKVQVNDSEISLDELVLKSSGKERKTIFNGKELGSGERLRCHLDPQLRAYYDDLPFAASLGQMGIPGKLLQKYSIGKGDLFLFFGNFAFADRETYHIDRKKMDSYDGFFHCLWGYMEIDYVVENPSEDDSRLPAYIRKHNPHCHYTSDGNFIYVAKDKLSDIWCPDELKGHVRGAGVFSFCDDLVLSEPKKGKKWNRNQWNILPLNINQGKKSEIPKRGQEFILYEDTDSELLNEKMTIKFKDIIRRQADINPEFLI